MEMITSPSRPSTLAPGSLATTLGTNLRLLFLPWDESASVPDESVSETLTSAFPSFRPILVLGGSLKLERAHPIRVLPSRPLIET